MKIPFFRKKTVSQMNYVLVQWQGQGLGNPIFQLLIVKQKGHIDSEDIIEQVEKVVQVNRNNPVKIGSLTWRPLSYAEARTTLALNDPRLFKGKTNCERVILK